MLFGVAALALAIAALSVLTGFIIGYGVGFRDGAGHTRTVE